MIDFTNIYLYFNLTDPLSQKIITKLDAIIEMHAPDTLKKEYVEGVALRVKAVAKAMNAPEEARSRESFSFFYHYAYLAKIDVFIVLYTLLCEYELNFKRESMFSIENRHKNEYVIDPPFYTDVFIGEFISSEMVKTRDFVSSVCEETLFNLCKHITFGTNKIEDVRAAFTKYLDFYPEVKEDTTEKAASIRTLANFGGTLQGARDHLNKYFPK